MPRKSLTGHNNLILFLERLGEDEFLKLFRFFASTQVLKGTKHQKLWQEIKTVIANSKTWDETNG